jgi:hypothetical protein
MIIVIDDDGMFETEVGTGLFGKLDGTEVKVTEVTDPDNGVATEAIYENETDVGISVKSMTTTDCDEIK